MRRIRFAVPVVAATCVIVVALPLAAQGDRRAPAEDSSAAEYAEILTRSQALPTGLSSLGTRDVRRFNQQRAVVRAELKAWADKHGFDLVVKRVCHEVPDDPSPAPEEVQRRIGHVQTDQNVSCPDSVIIDGMHCMLTGIDTSPAHTGAGYSYDCIYECARPKEDGKSK